MLQSHIFAGKKTFMKKTTHSDRSLELDTVSLGVPKKTWSDIQFEVWLRECVMNNLPPIAFAQHRRMLHTLPVCISSRERMRRIVHQSVCFMNQEHALHPPDPSKRFSTYFLFDCEPRHAIQLMALRRRLPHTYIPITHTVALDEEDERALTTCCQTMAIPPRVTVNPRTLRYCLGFDLSVSIPYRRAPQFGFGVHVMIHPDAFILIQSALEIDQTAETAAEEKQKWMEEYKKKINASTTLLTDAVGMLIYPELFDLQLERLKQCMQQNASGRVTFPFDMVGSLASSDLLRPPGVKPYRAGQAGGFRSEPAYEHFTCPDPAFERMIAPFSHYLNTCKAFDAYAPILRKQAQSVYAYKTGAQMRLQSYTEFQHEFMWSLASTGHYGTFDATVFKRYITEVLHGMWESQQSARVKYMFRMLLCVHYVDALVVAPAAQAPAAQALLAPTLYVHELPVPMNVCLESLMLRECVSIRDRERIQLDCAPDALPVLREWFATKCIDQTYSTWQRTCAFRFAYRYNIVSLERMLFAQDLIALLQGYMRRRKPRVYSFFIKEYNAMVEQYEEAFERADETMKPIFDALDLLFNNL